MSSTYFTQWCQGRSWFQLHRPLEVLVYRNSSQVTCWFFLLLHCVMSPNFTDRGEKPRMFAEEQRRANSWQMKQHTGSQGWVERGRCWWTDMGVQNCRVTGDQGEKTAMNTVSKTGPVNKNILLILQVKRLYQFLIVRNSQKKQTQQPPVERPSHVHYSGETHAPAFFFFVFQSSPRLTDFSIKNKSTTRIIL